MLNVEEHEKILNSLRQSAQRAKQNAARSSGSFNAFAGGHPRLRLNPFDHFDIGCSRKCDGLNVAEIRYPGAIAPANAIDEELLAADMNRLIMVQAAARLTCVSLFCVVDVKEQTIR